MCFAVECLGQVAVFSRRCWSPAISAPSQ